MRACRGLGEIDRDSEISVAPKAMSVELQGLTD